MSNWPDEFPKRLRDVCWSLNDGELVGIMPYWNRHCSYETRGSELFLKTHIENYFDKNGVSAKTVEELIAFILKTFTIYYNDDQQVFKVSVKKNKETEKREVDKEALKGISANLGFSGKQTTEMIKLVLEDAISFYNSLIGIKR